MTSRNQPPPEDSEMFGPIVRRDFRSRDAVANSDAHSSWDLEERIVYIRKEALDQMLELGRKHGARSRKVEVSFLCLGRRAEDQHGKYTIIESLPLLATGEATTVKLPIEVKEQARRSAPVLDVVGWAHTHPGYGIFFSGPDRSTCGDFGAESVNLVYDPINEQLGIALADEIKIKIQAPTHGLSASTPMPVAPPAGGRDMPETPRGGTDAFAAQPPGQEIPQAAAPAAALDGITLYILCVVGLVPGVVCIALLYLLSDSLDDMSAKIQALLIGNKNALNQVAEQLARVESGLPPHGTCLAVVPQRADGGNQPAENPAAPPASPPQRAPGPRPGAPKQGSGRQPGKSKAEKPPEPPTPPSPPANEAEPAAPRGVAPEHSRTLDIGETPPG